MCYGCAPLSIEESIKYHAEFCCEGNEKLRKKIEKEIEFMEKKRKKEKNKKNMIVFCNNLCTDKIANFIHFHTDIQWKIPDLFWKKWIKTKIVKTKKN